MTLNSKMRDIANEIFSQVRTTIVMNMRFLDMAVFRLKLVPEKISLATDGQHLFYNPVWLLKRYRQESNAVTRDYLHVLLHCIFRHPFVNTLIDQEKWNLACDIAVEGLICEFDQSHLATQNERKRSAVIDGLKKKIRPFTAEKLYSYFQDHIPDTRWMELFYADDHSIWYQSGKPTGSSGQNSNCSKDNRRDSQRNQQADDDSFTVQKKVSDNNSDADNSQNNGTDGNSDMESSQNNQSDDNSHRDGFQNNDSNGGSDIDRDLNVVQRLLSRQELEDEWRDISEHVQMDLETFAKQQGIQAGGMQQMLAELNRERYNYEAFLKKFAVMGEVMKINDDEFDYIFYTYGLKLFKNMPLIEPLEYKDVKRIREFVIAIDTSGSTSGELVQKFLQKTYNILKSTESFFSKINLHIIQCDAQIQEDVKITCQEEFDEYLKRMTIKGLGGTDFRPVFQYVDQLLAVKEFIRLKGLIYFTDGFGTFPGRKPNYNTAFVFVQDAWNNLDVPPWAIKLILEKDEI